MFHKTHYLEWARRYYGKVRFDLATSGIPTVPMAELAIPEPDRLDDARGYDLAREAIAAYHGVPPNEVIAALGTTHALWLAYASVLGPSDEVLVEEPAYEPLLRIAEGVGARVSRFRREPGDGFALDPHRVARAMTPQTRLIAVTNLHNPSGVRAADESLRVLAQVAERARAYLLVDEVYAPFDELTDEQGVFRGSARRLGPNVIAAASLTKCYGLGPLRAGWLIGPADVVERARDALTASCGDLPLVHAHFACRAFVHIGSLARRTRGILRGKRERVATWVASHESDGLTWSRPSEGTFALVTLTGRADITSAIESAAVQSGVLVAAGSFFGVPNAFRIAWTAPEAVLDEGLARLSDTVVALPGRG